MGEEFKDLIDEVMQSRFSVKTDIPDDISNFKVFVKDEYYPVGSEGCLGLWTGRQKSRKTFALNCAIASALMGEPVGPFSYEPNGGLILHFDTEQPRNRFLITQRRLHALAHSDFQTDFDRYYSFNLRRYNHKTRVAIINYFIKMFVREKQKIDLIVIDGVVDLCENFMENTAAQETAQELMTWGDMTDASIYSVLHMNKMGGEVRGHLGTELSNKVDFVLGVEKKKDDDVYSKVFCKDSRYFPFPSFDIYQTREGMLDKELGSWQGEVEMFKDEFISPFIGSN